MSNEADRNPRKALGKGLSALLPTRTTSSAGLPPAVSGKVLPIHFEDFQSLPLSVIQPGSGQPRTAFDQERLEELAQSIKANGVLQPITVQKHADGQYRIIAGERRWRAAALAGLTEIPALVRTVEDSQRLELALIENIQREDLNPLEIAAGFERLSSEHKMSHEQIAERTGKDRSTVTNLLRLLRLGEASKKALRGGQISTGHARALLNLTDEDQQAAACKMIIENKLSVRDTEALVKGLTEEEPPVTSAPKAEGSAAKAEKKLDPNIRAALDDMAMALGTKVNLKPRRLEIEYYSPEDLERIYSVIVKQ